MTKNSLSWPVIWFKNTSYQLALEVENILPNIEDAQLKAFLGLRDELRHWSLRELRDVRPMV